MTNGVIHFEVPADDIQRAKKFYSIFGWQIDDMPGTDYVSLITGPVDQNYMPKEPGMINGGMMKRSKEIKSPVFAINVNSVDDYIKKVEAAGGKVVTPKMEVMDMGYYAYVTDTEGNIIGLWESKTQ